MSKIYVASSWRNELQQTVVKKLRDAGHEVYDFKNPSVGDNGFHWSEIDKDWKEWTPSEFIHGLTHPIAVEGFNKDYEAMKRSDICVLVLPSGRSAHLEAGHFVGTGKLLAILLCDGEPELMYKMAALIFTDIESLVSGIGLKRI